MHTEQIFELSKLSYGLSGCLSAIVINGSNGMNLRMATPGVVSAYEWDSTKSPGNKLNFLSPFPFVRTAAPNSSFIAKRRDLKVFDYCFIDKHKVVSTSEFRHKNIDKLKEYVKYNGTVTIELIRKNIKGKNPYGSGIAMLDFLDNLEEMVSKFKYHSVQYLNYANGFKAREVEELAYALTFIDLHYCIPIYNSRKVDGMGLIIDIMLEGPNYPTSSVASAGKLVLLLSNYADNLFVVDGVSICDITLLTKNTIQKIYKVVESNINTTAKEKKDKKEKSYKQQADKYSSRGYWADGASASSTVTYSSSYYVTTSR